MNYQLFHAIHIISVILLVAVAFAAFSAPISEKRKRYLSLSGIASLVALLAGFGLLGILKLGFPLWVWVKLLCWLILSAMPGLVYRLSERRQELILCSIGLVCLAVAMVSFKPGV